MCIQDDKDLFPSYDEEIDLDEVIDGLVEDAVDLTEGYDDE